MVSRVNDHHVGDSFWELRIPSELRLGQDIVERFIERAEQRGITRIEANALRHGIHEAVVNAIIHGNGGNPDLQVRVAYGFRGREVWIEVEDEGPGFRPSDVPDPGTAENCARPGGRGLLMMEHFMCSVEYNDRGNRVTMRRECNIEAN